MGTNFYARIIPTKEKKKELHDAIDNDNISKVQTLIHEMYDSIYIDYSHKEIKGGCVHLGKRSSGWKFLWNPNIFLVRNGHRELVKHSNGSETSQWVTEPNTAIYTYPLTKEGIKAFIDREDVIIYDEYGEKQDKKEFWKEALEWGQPDGWDAAGYEKEYKEPIYPVTGEFTDLLRQEGYMFTSRRNSDFYSDGLRFAGFTEFS